MGEHLVRAGDTADPHFKKLGKRQGVIALQKHELPVDFRKPASVVHVSTRAPFLETENGAVGHVSAEHAAVAGFDEIRDVALTVEPGVELLRRRQLDEFARYDEYQFPARFQVAHAFFDEKQKQVAALVEQIHRKAGSGRFGNILKAHIGRVADDGVKLLAVGIGEKILHADARRRDARVDFDADAIPSRRTQGGEKRARARRRFQHASAIAAERAHEIHDRRRREYLPQIFDIKPVHGCFMGGQIYQT